MSQSDELPPVSEPLPITEGGEVVKIPAWFSIAHLKALMMEEPPDTFTDLRHTLREIAVHPIRTLVPPWSWKAAAFAAAVRGGAFFITNLRAGRSEAMKALVVEAFFALISGGVIGAISQQLRRAEPLWATAIVVCICCPGMMLLAQSEVHHLAHTPHLSGGLALSFCLASLSAAFSWYAMRHGAMLGGSAETTFQHDMKALPHILLGFVIAGPSFAHSIIRKKARSANP